MKLLVVLTAACLAWAGLQVPSLAQDRPDARRPDAHRPEQHQPEPHQSEPRRPNPLPPAPPRPRPPPFQLDQRHQHDQYYPSRGQVVRVLPQGSISVGFRDTSLFFHGGVWFRPQGTRFVVIAPPIGIVVPFLPRTHVTLWISGLPYYYANSVYYSTVPAGGYMVVEPPPGTSEGTSPTATRTAPEPIFYPRSGQSAEQTEIDRRECNRWATTQAGAMADADIFQRAVAACMDGRGYSVR